MKSFELLNMVRNAALVIVRTIDQHECLVQENKELRLELQKYKDMIYKQANAPSPHLGWINAIMEGKVTFNSDKPSVDQTERKE